MQGGEETQKEVSGPWHLGGDTAPKVSIVIYRWGKISKTLVTGAIATYLVAGDNPFKRQTSIK